MKTFATKMKETLMYCLKVADIIGVPWLIIWWVTALLSDTVHWK